MTAFLQIIQIIGLNAALLGIIKVISLLYRYYTRGTVRIQEKYNVRHGLPKDYAVSVIDENSVDYQFDTLEGTVFAGCLILGGGVLTLFGAIQDAGLFSIIALILSLAELLGCLLTSRGAKKIYRILL